MTYTCTRPVTPFRASLRALACCVALAGCTAAGQSAPAMPEVRVLIGLPAHVHADDAAWQARLADAAGTPLVLAASVSPGWAAYVMRCPAPDSDCDDAIDKLRQSGLVRSVERDTRRSTR
ncbi:MAG: hypothetical protein QM639_10600 [Rhodocyclaceae bacterium]